MTGDMLTVEEVAGMVRLCDDAVRRAIRAGELRASKMRGRYRIPPDAVDAWIAATSVIPGAFDRAPTAATAVRQNLDAYRLTL